MNKRPQCPLCRYGMFPAEKALALTQQRTEYLCDAPRGDRHEFTQAGFEQAANRRRKVA